MDIIMCLTVIDNVILFVACYPYFGLIFFIGTIILFCWSMNYEKKYVKFYKEEVITSFIKLINKELEYKPFGYGYFEQKEEYRKAKFDNKVFNSFNLDDYIEGFVDEQTFIKMCDLHIQHHTERGESTYAEEIFQGIFAQTKCGKDIGTYLKVSKNKIKILQQQDRVEMDSEEFEKYFDIYSENKIIAMQLLTSDIMEFLTDFYNKYKLDYEIVFRNNTIYMRFFTGPMFETNGNAMDKEILFKYFCIFKFVLEISKKVNKTLQEMEI